MSDQASKKSLLFSDPYDDIGSNASPVAPIGVVIAARLSRRTLLKGMLASATVAVGAGLSGRWGLSTASASGETPAATSTLTFEELAHGVDETHGVAKGYDAEVLVRWGDPLFADAPPFDPTNLNADAREKQFGYNNDYVAFMPLPQGSTGTNHGLLCVNHEYWYYP